MSMIILFYYFATMQSRAILDAKLISPCHLPTPLTPVDQPLMGPSGLTQNPSVWAVGFVLKFVVPFKCRPMSTGYHSMRIVAIGTYKWSTSATCTVS